MIEGDAKKALEAAGSNGVDIQHVEVRVLREIRVGPDGNSTTLGWKAHAGLAAGDLVATQPTKFYFVSVTPGWKFHDFDCDGENYPGIIVLPKTTDYSAQRSSDGLIVTLDNAHEFNGTVRYQVVLRNEAGEIALNDPSVDNTDSGPGNRG